MLDMGDKAAHITLVESLARQQGVIDQASHDGVLDQLADPSKAHDQSRVWEIFKERWDGLPDNDRKQLIEKALMTPEKASA